MSYELQTTLLLTFIGLIPFFLLALTPFPKFVIILSFVRRAVSTPSAPPNQIIFTLALFLTLLQISPLIENFNSQILKPYSQQKLSPKEVYTKTEILLKKHLKKDADIILIKFLKPILKTSGDNLSLLLAAYSFQQIKKGLIAGIIIYLPFMLIDLILAAILLSLGIFMLSPMFISLPFKIGLFLLLGGWDFILKILLYL